MNESQFDELISSLRNEYLWHRDRYDRWGEQGKILLVQRLLDSRGLKFSFSQIRWLVNDAFPRTFACTVPEPPEPHADLSRRVAARFASLTTLFFAHGMSPRRSEHAALEETAELFCLPPLRIAALLRLSRAV
ncbi:MAG TPA: hypothetical protein VMW43_03075 [Bacteroidota bacterium]|nr:hypothetical protein [Bacteroidota bacterium]